VSRLVDAEANTARAQVTVVVRVNIGLLGAHGALPSLFEKALDQAQDGELRELLNRLEHPLLRARLTALRPEWHQPILSRGASARGTGMGRDWELLKSRLARLLHLDSPSGIHFLFRGAFPELGIRVRRTAETQLTPAPRFSVGESPLGAPIGSRAAVTVRGVEVTLYAKEEREQGTWTNEVRLRFVAQVAPLIAGSPLRLAVRLVERRVAASALDENSGLGDTAIGAPASGAGEGQLVIEFQTRPVVN
jgi:hypothetical protein